MAGLFFAFALVVASGAATAVWALDRRSRSIERWGAGLALGAPLGGAAIALLLAAGLTPGAAAWTWLALAGAAITLSVFVRRLAPLVPEPRTAWWIALAFVLATAAFPLISEWWRVYSDNWTHAMIVRAVLERVPPLDPGFAGVPLQYPWIYHAFVAGVEAMTHADVFGIMLLLSAVALAALVLGAAAALPPARARDTGWTLLLLLLGMNALFPVFAPMLAAKAFIGEVKGTAELARQFDLRPLQWETTGIFLRAFSGQSFFLDKFTVVTPFALSLAAFASWYASFRRWLADGVRRELALGALLTLAAGLMHPVTGAFLGGATVLAFAFALVFARRGTTERGRLLGWACATAAGLVPVVLYTKTVIGGGGGTHSELPFDLAPLKMLGYATCLALGLLFAIRPWRQASRTAGAGRAEALWLLAAFVVAIVSRLPGPSPFFTVDKLAYLVWIPLALMAGPAFAEWMRARTTVTRVVLALLLFVPVNGLALASRVADPHNAARMPFELPGFAWLRVHTPKDAVLLVQLGDWESAGFAERDQYTSRGHPAYQLGYDEKEIAAREDLEKRLFATGRLEPRDLARLAELKRPVYVVWADFRDPLWKWTPGTIAREQIPAGPKPAFDPALEVVFESPELEVRSVPLAPSSQ